MVLLELDGSEKRLTMANEGVLHAQSLEWIDMRGGDERDEIAPKCFCGVYVILYKSRITTNPNRMFLKYPYFKAIAWSLGWPNLGIWDGALNGIWVGADGLTVDCAGTFVPKIGMTFNTLEETENFYKDYSKLVGFSTKIHNTNKKKNEIKNQLITCNREEK
ncbi:hypothetical protein Ahy_A09g042741 [Arachis hypogaea]|uniref:Uncharacterized protein n=1 Tax=Arachis hypogaea TaxID=3818 RepID=A0A445BGM8_ARAHY|nr:hypothetical protein Ahy_A09g042741 [Arachis hypogaea]